MLNTIVSLIKSPVFPVVEFSVIISLIIVTYWGIHSFRYSLKPPTKMVLSMFIASIGYAGAKFIIFSIFAASLIQNSSASYGF